MVELEKQKKYLKNGKKNMEYDIVISDTCLKEIEDICEYIEKTLNEKTASNKLRKKIRESIKRIKQFPKIYAKIEKQDRQKREYRRKVVGNYIILYTIIEENKVILISHVYYGRKDYINDFI